jgi:hypothetical protein
MRYDDYTQELTHIRAMILQLEHLIRNNDSGLPMPVTSPDYWRARLSAVLEAGLPPALKPQVQALLARLDALLAASHRRS